MKKIFLILLLPTLVFTKPNRFERKIHRRYMQQDMFAYIDGLNTTQSYRLYKFKDQCDQDLHKIMLKTKIKNGIPDKQYEIYRDAIIELSAYAQKRPHYVKACKSAHRRKIIQTISTELFYVLTFIVPPLAFICY